MVSFYSIDSNILITIGSSPLQAYITINFMLILAFHSLFMNSLVLFLINHSPAYLIFTLITLLLHLEIRTANNILMFINDSNVELEANRGKWPHHKIGFHRAGHK